MKTAPFDECCSGGGLGVGGFGGGYVDDDVVAWAVKEVLITVAKDFT